VASPTDSKTTAVAAVTSRTPAPVRAPRLTAACTTDTVEPSSTMVQLTASRAAPGSSSG
jgi:hypothetical protein